MNNGFSFPRVSYGLAYLLSTVGMAGVWTGVLAIIGLTFGTVMASPSVSVLQAQIFIAVSLPFVALFTGQGVLTAFLDGYAKGAFSIESEVQPQSVAKPTNPWLCGLKLALFLGAPSAIGVVYLLHHLYSNRHELTPWELTLFLAVSGAIVATIGTAWICGRVFWNEVAVPIPNRLYADSQRTYIWLRLIVPNGLANLIINGWVAAAIFPRADSNAGPLAFILTDISITTAIIFMFVSSGACNHVISDRRWGIIAALGQEKSPPVVLRLILPFLFAIVSGLLTWALFTAAAISRLDLWSFVFWKALTACAIAGAAAHVGAQWGLATELQHDRIEG